MAEGLSPIFADESEGETTALAQTALGDSRAFFPASIKTVHYDNIGYHPVIGLNLKAPANCIYWKEHRSPILSVLIDALAETDFSKLSA